MSILESINMDISGDDPYAIIVYIRTVIEVERMLEINQRYQCYNTSYVGFANSLDLQATNILCIQDFQ